MQNVADWEKSVKSRQVNNMKNFTVLFAALMILASFNSSIAQERYDGLEPVEKFNIRFGGFVQNDIDSTLRVDSTELGIGTIVRLEDILDVDNKVTVFRLDGFYRFNERHRIDWTWYSTSRDGSSTITEEIQVGDEIFKVGTRIDTEFDVDIYKVGWAWSFINVRRYEFYIGLGLNIRDFSIMESIRGDVQRAHEMVTTPTARRAEFHIEPKIEMTESGFLDALDDDTIEPLNNDMSLERLVRTDSLFDYGAY